VAILSIFFVSKFRNELEKTYRGAVSMREVYEMQLFVLKSKLKHDGPRLGSRVLSVS